MSEDIDASVAQTVIERIAAVAEAIGCQAGVGGMETAGSIISYLAENPGQITDFMAEQTSVMDWPIGWHEQGRLTWHGMDGKIHRPEHARRQRMIRKLERGA